VWTLPGDLVIAKADGVIFVPAYLAAGAIANAEFTNLLDAFNFELNASGKNGNSLLTPAIKRAQTTFPAELNN
jgi:regulator of RNase E activity RraA